MKKLLLILILLIASISQELYSQEPLPDTVWTKQLSYYQSEAVYDFKFSPDGQYIYAWIQDTIYKFETLSGNRSDVSFRHGGNWGRINFSPTGDTLLTSSGNRSLKLWNPSTGELLTSMSIDDEYHKKLRDASFFDNGNKIICSIVKLPEDSTLPDFAVFDVKTGNLILEFGDKQNSSHLKVSPSGKYFSFGGQAYPPFPSLPPRGDLYLYDLHTYKELQQLDSKELIGVGDIEFSYDGKYLATGESDGKVNIWDVEDRNLLKVLNTSVNVWDIAFSKDNKFLLVGTGYTGYGSIWVYDVENDFEKIYEYSPPLSTGSLFDISPNSKYIFSIGYYKNQDNLHAHLQLLNIKWTGVEVKEHFTKDEIIYPNPTSNIVNIQFTINKYENVDIQIFDISGKVIDDIFKGYLEKGNQIIPYNCSQLSAGTYFIKIIAPSFTKTVKLVK